MTIGIIGGLSYESTAEYLKYFAEWTLKDGKLEKTIAEINSYELENKSFNEENRSNLGDYCSPKKFFYFKNLDTYVSNQNLQECFELQRNNNWEKEAKLFEESLYELEDFGVNVAAIASNTPHHSLRYLNNSPIEIITIMDATAKEIQKYNQTKVGLIGTKETMEQGFFQSTFEKYGIETIIPKKEDREIIDNVIWNELVHGKIIEESKQKYLDIIDHMDIQGIILGCTEIPLLIKQEDCNIKIYNTTKLHAESIVKYF